MSAHDHRPLDGLVHRELLLGMLEHGRAPAQDELAGRLGTSSAEIRESLLRLEANHGVVLHPGTIAPWVIHPFSTTPTSFFVEGPRRGWWAPCVWCALGIAVLAPAPVRITTRSGGESASCTIAYDEGRVSPAGLVAHFPIPVARAWDNVHRHCACTLVFEDRVAIDAWCARHGIARGEVLALEKVAELARVWYGEHLAPEWRKPTASEARRRFESVGLTSPHWHVPDGDERF